MATTGCVRLEHLERVQAQILRWTVQQLVEGSGGAVLDGGEVAVRLDFVYLLHFWMKFIAVKELP